MDADRSTPNFVRLGPAVPRRPVLLAVPHAGRDYPDALLANAAVSRDRLESLEDRHADALIGDAVRDGTAAFVARLPRSWLDLNRDEREIDPATVTPPLPPHRLIQSAKLRGGLGLIPRRLPGSADLWRAPLPAAEIEARIAGYHQPFHLAIAAELDRMRALFGVAVLIDFHTMPPIPAGVFGAAAQVVIGDRYGRSASPRLVERIGAAARSAGLQTVRNAPYAGGYTLDRHARPACGQHAIQVEVDRTLYLAADRRSLAAGAAAMRQLVAAMVNAVVDELAEDPAAMAAE